MPGRGAGKYQLSSWSRRCFTVDSKEEMRHFSGFQMSRLWRGVLGPYTFLHVWRHPAQPAPPHSLVMTTFNMQGQHQMANGSLLCPRMKAFPKPMEVTILIAGRDWSHIPGVGASLGSALQAGKKRLSAKSRWEKRAGQQGKCTC